MSGDAGTRRGDAAAAHGEPLAASPPPRVAASNAESGGVRLVLVTAPDAAVAERLVRALVDEGIVACGNLVPGLTSIYRWQGAVTCEAEVLIVLKTTAAAVPRLLERVPALHPYEVPEVLVVPVEAGHAAYLVWVAESVRTGEPKD